MQTPIHAIPVTIIIISILLNMPMPIIETKGIIMIPNATSAIIAPPTSEQFSVPTNSRLPIILPLVESPVIEVEYSSLPTLINLIYYNSY